MANFEYLHTRIIAAEDVDEEEEGEVPYLDEYVQGELNRLGQEGWELVNMTPDWEWAYDSPRGALVEASYSFPDYISGWYCTFKRPLV